MDLKFEVNNQKRNAKELIFPCVFLVVFSAIWIGVGIGTGEVVLLLVSFIPLGLLVLFSTAIIRHYLHYRRGLLVLEKGVKEKVKVVDMSSFGVESNNNGAKYSVLVEFTHNGETVKVRTPRVYTQMQAEFLLKKGMVNAQRYNKYVLITEEILIGYEGDDIYDDEYDRMYNPHLYEDEVVEGEGNSAFAVQRSQRKPKMHMHRSDMELLCEMADQGNRDAQELMKLPTLYDKMKYCALNNIDEDVEELVNNMYCNYTEAEFMRIQQEWFRGLRSDISTAPLEDSMRLINYLGNWLEAEEVTELINLFITQSQKTEQFMLPSAIIRQVKEYKAVLAMLDNIKKAEDFSQIVVAVEGYGSIKSLTGVVRGVALGKCKTSKESDKLLKILEELNNGRA